MTTARTHSWSPEKSKPDCHCHWPESMDPLHHLYQVQVKFSLTSNAKVPTNMRLLWEGAREIGTASWSIFPALLRIMSVLQRVLGVNTTRLLKVPPSNVGRTLSTFMPWPHWISFSFTKYLLPYTQVVHFPRKGGHNVRKISRGKCNHVPARWGQKSTLRT